MSHNITEIYFLPSRRGKSNVLSSNITSVLLTRGAVSVYHCTVTERVISLKKIMDPTDSGPQLFRMFYKASNCLYIRLFTRNNIFILERKKNHSLLLLIASFVIVL